jgi:CRISPR/Cas system-associated endonuclease Cas3-HD
VAINNKLYSKTFWDTLILKHNRWHRHGVLIHTLKVVYQVCKAKDYKFLATAFFHDLGKPIVAYRDEEDKKTGEYSFRDHEEISYQIVKNWPFLSQWTKEMIRFHYIIRDRINSKRKGNLTRLKRLDDAWDKLSPEFIVDLEQFLIYDDRGKK